METDKGLLLAGDSRLSRKNDPSWHKDNAEKVFECKNKVGIAYHGDADINGEPMSDIIEKFILAISKEYLFDEILIKLQEHIKSKGKPNTKFYLVGYENYQRKIVGFNVFEDTLSDLSGSVHGSGGEDEVAWSMMKGRFDIHSTIEDALVFIEQIYKNTIEKITTVGGETDILLISKNGQTKWIQHKRFMYFKDYEEKFPS